MKSSRFRTFDKATAQISPASNHSYQLFALGAALFFACGCAWANDTSWELQRELVSGKEATAKAQPARSDDKAYVSQIETAIGVYDAKTETLRVSKWQKSLLVSIEDENGRDLDVTTFPGSAIVAYIDSISEYTGIDIGLVKTYERKNNVSIVVGDSNKRIQRGAGTIFQVPSLATSTEPLSGLLSMDGRQSIEYSPLPGNVYWNELRDGSAIKACAIGIAVTGNPDFDTPSHIWEVMNVSFSECLGFKNRSSSMEHHSFYFLRELYRPNIYSAMSAREAAKIIADSSTQDHTSLVKGKPNAIQ